jgi:hypothetical protein
LLGIPTRLPTPRSRLSEAGRVCFRPKRHPKELNFFNALTISRKNVDFYEPFIKQTGTMAKPRLLVVEDETKVAQFIKKGLETQGYTVEYRQAA